MYIRKQPSGSTRQSAAQSKKGRGEYEISGKFEGTVPAVEPSDLADKELFFRFGRYGYKPTANVLRLKYGKKRIELRDPNRFIHGARQVQAALLFPKSRRGEDGLLGGRPTIMFERYIVRRMNFRSISLQDAAARIELGDLDLYNGSQEDSVDFGQRMREVERIHDNAGMFPSKIRDLLNEHRRILEAAAPVSEQAERIVATLMEEVQKVAPDYNIDYVSGADVLPPLKDVISIPQVDEPARLESIPEEDVEIRRREAAQWRRYAAVRGPEAASFRRKVREAYNSTCIICGIRLPQSQHCRIPGVDSAHILPWATHDLELVSNGLCLCKSHHWAFDQQLISITFEDNEYHVRVTERARLAIAAEALEKLNVPAGPIPRERLPRNREHRPRPEFLSELYRLVHL